MSTLAEIEAAADTLSTEEKQKLLLHVTKSLREELPLPPGRRYGSVEEAWAAEGNGEKERRELTPQEVEAILDKISGVGTSGMTTDEHMALMRGDE